MIGHNGGPSLNRNSGWVSIHRSIREHPIVGFHIHVKPADPERGAMQPALAFVDLIMECRYEAGYVMNGGRKMEVQRGQLLGAVSWLAARWNWTPKTVRGFLDRLENDGMIERVRPGIEEGKQKGKQANLLSICNYDKYQRQPDDEGQATGQVEGKQGASKGQAEGHIYKDNKGTKEQGNKEENPSDLSPSGDDAGAVSKKVKVRDVAHEAFVEWQDFAKLHGLPVPRDASFDTFAQKIALRLRENADELSRDAMLRVWRLALAYVAKSKHCRGDNDRGWRADLEFICRREKFAKLLSGGFGNGAAPLDDRWRIDAPGTASHVSARQPPKDSQYADWRADLEAMGIEFHGAPE